jgi:sugar lactone lactonase YvrE
MKNSTKSRSLVFAVSFCLLLGMVSTLSAAEIRYENGSLINLATVRGTRAYASPNLKGDEPPASFLLHKVEGEIRYDSKFGPCWWMMELPQSYNISSVRLSFRDVITSVGFRIKTAERQPIDWRSVAPVASFKGPLIQAAMGQKTALVEFRPVKAKFVRIEFDGHNGGENGRGDGHQDLVVSQLQVSGPNDLAITPAISLAQSAWAGGRSTVHDCTVDERSQDGKVKQRPPRDFPEVIDDNGRASSEVGSSASYFTKGSPPDESIEQTKMPASIVVTLKDRARVEAVAYSAIGRARQERPRDIKIYTSPFEIGDEWTLQKELKDIPGGEYEEVALDQPALANRVRFDIERVWNPKIDGNLKAAEGRLSELYVYGSALPPDFEYVVKEASQASSQILDKDGNVIRTLERARAVPPGTYGLTWDGLDDLGNKMPPGEYLGRVVLNPTVYITAGAIGNSAQPPTINQNPHHLESVAVDAAGQVYTANLWEEAAQDFRKLDRNTGNHVYNSRGSIRNGKPNALPYAIAVDDKYLYCSTTSLVNHGQQHLRRFRLADGEPAPFPTATKTDGHILLHDYPEKEISAEATEADKEILKMPLRALASARGKLYAVDALANKMLIFDRESGAAAGSLDVRLPHALAIDFGGRIWVGHENGKISVFSPEGRRFVEVINDLGHVQALAFGPGDTLYVADSRAEKIFIYGVDAKSKTAVLLRSFGEKAVPADFAPDRFYKLAGLAVDTRGTLTVAQNFLVAGARVTRFAPDGRVLWDQVGGEFCSTGNYSQERPDELISHHFNRYKLNKKSGAWEFRGCVLDGDPRYIKWQHGVMRLQKLGGNEFLFQAYGDGLQVYRREGEVYRLASMFGRNNPFPDGTYRDTIPENQCPPSKEPWSWHDANGNGQVNEEEITWLKDELDPRIDSAHFGINVDKAGNALLCEYAGNVREVPMTGLDERGNPVYDLAKSRVVVPRDASEKPLLADPIMAVRADDGSVYVHSRSKVFAAPSESGGGWMAGWMLARYSKDGKRLWYTRLPNACPGMDAIPGPDGGVMLVSIRWGKNGSEIYHYASDGSLIGVTWPDEKFRGYGGIPDNTASLAISRDPRDGILDVFVEDCVGNRMRWQRVDDRRKPESRVVGLRLGNPDPTFIE